MIKTFASAKTRIISLLALGSMAALVGISPAQAASITINVDHDSAIVGENVTVSGAVSGNVKTVELERTLYGVEIAHTRVHRGHYSFTFPMLAMPREGFQVRAQGGHSSTVYVNSQQQEVKLLPQNGALMVEIDPGQARPVVLQRQTGPASWVDVASTNTDGSGLGSFAAASGPTYRAWAPVNGGIPAYYSAPLVTAYPALASNSSSLNESGPTYAQQPTSHNDAASRYHWYPIALDRDWENGLGMDELTNYTEGTGRASLAYGGLWLQAGSPRPDLPSFGTTSSTFQGRGFKTGNWEMRSKMVQRDPAFTPYTVRYELVPARTPDGVEPANSIIVGEYAGYGTSTSVGLRDSSHLYMKSFGGFNHNSANWHAYAVQVSKKRVTWLVNHKIVASMKRPATLRSKLVPRVEMVAPANTRMTYTTLLTDWIRYFKLKPHDVLKGSSSGFTVSNF